MQFNFKPVISFVIRIRSRGIFIPGSIMLLLLMSVVLPLLATHPEAEEIRTDNEQKRAVEILGFAPYWTIPDVSEVQFDKLTTIAYFDLPLLPSGMIDTNSNGYRSLHLQKSTKLLQAARDKQVHVAMTVSMLQNNDIVSFLENKESWPVAMGQIFSILKTYQSDTVVLDIEYAGSTSPQLKHAFSQFVSQTQAFLKERDPSLRVITAVYASSTKPDSLYDISHISRSSDYVFMMAYDFATTSAQNAMPTAPLYGHKEGLYWYDISTAVDDFLTKMPKEKLILGIPYYGYNYALAEPPAVKAALTTGHAYAQTLQNIEKHVDPYIVSEGWDNYGKVGWKAYRDPLKNTVRIIFAEDERSLDEKYQFVNQQQLAGIGMWALGFESQENDIVWAVLDHHFLPKTS